MIEARSLWASCGLASGVCLARLLPNHMHCPPHILITAHYYTTIHHYGPMEKVGACCLAVCSLWSYPAGYNNNSRPATWRAHPLGHLAQLAPESATGAKQAD